MDSTTPSSSTPSLGSAAIPTFSAPSISGSADFLQSNTLISKFAFVLLVLFVYMVLFRLGSMIIGYFFLHSHKVQYIKGMVDAKTMITFTQDPSEKGSKTAYRSQNATDGIEFTWSVWVLIDPTSPSQNGQYKHIFHKGNSSIAETGLNFPNNAPGLYIAPNSNSLVVVMSTYNSINEELVIPGIPVNKWVSVIIRCTNSKLDVYINGAIAKSEMLQGIPKQNYGDIYVAMNGGFNGNISDLCYYDYALGIYDIQQISNSGPNTKMIGTSAINVTKSDYLSSRWYFYGDAAPAH
jgi:hypothetical protein